MNAPGAMRKPRGRLEVKSFRYDGIHVVAMIGKGEGESQGVTKPGELTLIASYGRFTLYLE